MVVLVDEEGGGAAEAETGVLLVLVAGVGGVGVASGKEDWTVVYGV